MPPQKLSGHITMEAKGQVLPWGNSRHKHGAAEVTITPVRQLGPVVVAVGARVVAVEKVKAAQRANRLRAQCLILGNMHACHVTLEVKLVRRQVMVGEVRSGPGRVGLGCL